MVGERKKRLGVLIGILHAHATMTVSADRLAKQVFVRRIVMINEKSIWKIEAHATERIPLARWLVYPN